MSERERHPEASARHEAGARAGRLSVVATPIGNLADITLRALATLREADAVLAEDTRQTRKLLAHHGIATPLRSLHAHSTPAAIERYAEELEAGKQLALCTDAGTPLVSDPGAKLVQAARARGVSVETIPGPSAVTAALCVAGLEFDSFRFAGFAPRAGQKREAWLGRIAGDEEACVFFEAPTRLAATLEDLARHLHPERAIAVCRELTKLHEQVVRGTAAELARQFAAGTRGEVTVVVGAGEVRTASAADDGGEPEAAHSPEARIAELLASGLSARDVARQIARETGLPRRKIYARVQALQTAAEREPAR